VQGGGWEHVVDELVSTHYAAVLSMPRAQAA
jgi:hypothetical protein